MLASAPWGVPKKKEALAATSTPVSSLPTIDEPHPQAAYPLFFQPFNQVDEVPNQWLQRYYSYYRRAIRNALSHSNRKPFQCGGLKAYDQLIAVEAHLHTRQQQLGTDPYLEELHYRVKAALQSSSELANSLRQSHICLRQLEHYLAQVSLPTLAASSARAQVQTSLSQLESPLEPCATLSICPTELPLTHPSDDTTLPSLLVAPTSDVELPNQEVITLAPPSEALPLLSTSQTVHSQLEQMVQQWQKSAPLNSTLTKLCRKWDSMAAKWLPAILHCYDIPGLPRNNLKLEARFGQLRQHQRRVSGRKETTPLRRLAPGQLLCPTLDESELLSYLQSVPTDDYWRERRKQEALEEPQRWLWRLHRHPLNALAQIDTQFSAFLEAKAEQRQALDSYL